MLIILLGVFVSMDKVFFLCCTTVFNIKTTTKIGKIKPMGCVKVGAKYVLVIVYGELRKNAATVVIDDNYGQFFTTLLC